MNTVKAGGWKYRTLKEKFLACENVQNIWTTARLHIMPNGDMDSSRAKANRGEPTPKPKRRKGEQGPG
jgi:hypothetical protein